MQEEFIENVTTIRCQECETIYNIKYFNEKNACATCECQNLQFIVKMIEHSYRVKSMLTISYKISEPIIHEVPSQGKRPEEVEKEKDSKSKFGFV